MDSLFAAMVSLFWFHAVICLCSSLMFAVFLQKQVAKLASELYYRWPLLRNNTTATNIQRL